MNPMIGFLYCVNRMTAEGCSFIDTLAVASDIVSEVAQELASHRPHEDAPWRSWNLEAMGPMLYFCKNFKWYL